MDSIFKNVHPHVLYAMGGIFVLLVVASLAVRFLQRQNPERNYSELSARVRTWWVMCAIFCSAMFLSKAVSIVFFGFVSFLALKEFFTLIPTRRADRRVLLWAYLAIVFQYLWVGMEWYGMFIIFIPVYLFLFIPFRLVLIGETEGFLRSAATIQWGLMITVFSLSHIGYLLTLPVQVNPNGGGAGLVLFLVVLTQLNDVAQYIWGKSFGKRKITPKVSPNKTWEGFLGGLATTVVLALLLAPLLTPLTVVHSLLAGLVIGGFGFVGDVSMSALKRDLGVKDSGQLLPGHGGVLDRVDSITYTAPLFFHFFWYLYA